MANKTKQKNWQVFSGPSSPKIIGKVLHLPPTSFSVIIHYRKNARGQRNLFL